MTTGVRTIADAEYLATQNKLMLIGNVLEMEDLVEFLNRINHGDAIGAMLDPTTYRVAMDRLQRIRALAQVAREYQRAFAELKTLVETEESSPSWRSQADLVRGRPVEGPSRSPPANVPR